MGQGIRVAQLPALGLGAGGQLLQGRKASDRDPRFSIGQSLPTFRSGP